MGTDREDRRDKETRYSFPHPFPSSVYQLFSSFHHIVVKISEFMSYKLISVPFSLSYLYLFILVFILCFPF